MADAPSSEANAPEEALAEPAAPEIEFDCAQHEIVVDLQAMCSIPFDAESSAVESLRAFQFDKGKVAHGPCAGSYATAGEYKTLGSLMLVHFKPSTKRKVELVLSFADYGMVANGATGVFVCSVPLPLMKRKGVYENSVRYTKLDDVMGFSKIVEGGAPWSIHLKPALQKMGGAHNTYKLFTTVEVGKYIEKPMMEKIEEQLKAAKDALSFHLEGIRRQDAALAEKQTAQFEAQLAKTKEFLVELPATNYDKPIDERIIKVSADGGSQEGQAWLTPSKSSALLSAEMPGPLIRTAKCRRSAKFAAVAPTSTAECSEEEMEPVGDEPGAEEEAQASSADVGYSKRARKRAEHFEFHSGPKKRAAKAKEKIDLGINPRTGKPYQRGPYEKDKRQGPASLLAAATKSISHNPPAFRPAVDSESVAKLKCRVSELEDQVKKLESDLALEKSSRELAVSNAKFEARDVLQRELLVQYQQGLQDGVNLSAGKANLRGFRVGGMSTPGCSGSSSSCGSGFS